MITIKSLTETNFDTVYTAWEDAFRDYERTWTKDELRITLKRRGYNPALSFGAFDDDKLVSFTLNATDIYNGIKTGYDAGTGTIKEYRGQGLAFEIFETAQPILKQDGVKRYILEVLHYNTPAVSVYKKVGFTINRELNYFVGKAKDVKPNNKTLPTTIELTEITAIDEDTMRAMWDFIPSWQNSFSSIRRAFSDFKIIGAYDKAELIGYGITDPTSGDITQLAVAKEYRRKGVGSAILKKLLEYNGHANVKVINTDRSLAHITSFVENNGIPNAGYQYEMIFDF